MTNNKQQTTVQKLKLRQLFTLKPKQWLLAWFIGLVTVIATVSLLAVSGWFISAAAVAGLVLSANAISFDFIRPAAVIRALAITRTAGRYGERLASHHAVLGLLTELRVVFFQQLSGQKISFVNSMVQSSDTMQRLTHDIDQLDELPLRFWAVWIWAICLQVGFLAFIAYFTPPLLMVVIVPLLLAGCGLPMVAVFFGKKLAFNQTQSAENRRRDLLNPLTASTNLVLWRRWHDFQQQFITSDSHYNDLHIRQQHIAMLLNTVQHLLLAVVILLLLWFGFDLVATEQLSVPLLLAYVLAIFGLHEILLPLAGSYTSFGFALASQQRLNALVEQNHTSLTTDKKPLTTPINSLQLTNVSAQFPHALTGFNKVHCQLTTGDILFITGRSGAGKSTLLHALAGELAIDNGTITINDSDITDLDISEKVGFLAQQLDIFDLTLAENLLVGNSHADEQQLWHALQMVGLAEWAKQQPQQLNTELGEYGTAISGGQSRRVALARLLLKPRDMLLLDEPFAGLDKATAQHIYQNLVNVQKDGILIIVSHQYIPDGAKCLQID